MQFSLFGFSKCNSFFVVTPQIRPQLLFFGFFLALKTPKGVLFFGGGPKIVTPKDEFLAKILQKWNKALEGTFLCYFSTAGKISVARNNVEQAASVMEQMPLQTGWVRRWIEVGASSAQHNPAKMLWKRGGRVGRMGKKGFFEGFPGFYHTNHQLWGMSELLSINAGQMANH